MRTVIKEIKAYSYPELSEKAKERVKQWYLDDPDRNIVFRDYCKEFYINEFPNSRLEPRYSLCYCQGDGYNTEGKLRISDVIDKLDLTEKEKRTLHFYFDNLQTTYTFETNRQYGYSCKFIDRKYVEATVDEAVEDAEGNRWKNVNSSLIRKMYELIFDYFEELDNTFEKSGYKYLYEVDEDEMSETCEANNWEFSENGEFLSDI